MILTKPKSNKKKIALIGLGIILALAIGSSVYVYAFNGNLFGWTNQPKTEQANSFDSPATDEQKTTGDKQKEEGITSGNEDPKQQTPERPTTPVEQPTTPKTVDMNITASAQNGSTLQIRVFVSALNNQGKCTLTLTQAGRANVVRTVGVQSQASASACDGFDIPVAEIPASGAWKATITYADPTSTGTTTQNVTITK